ncbi:hypothetical protein V6N11_070701 [Hibiscus sabdariffa]|uniref:RNase H type-1 domain-containing protein n=1 Tax=Hibiscus sabdariffa TaxID=183260 RepID=A0ABR2QG75_9ROSI
MVIEQRSRSVVWIPPVPSTIKLNIDGACRASDGVVSCEGVLRDSDGTWIAGFSKYVVDSDNIDVVRALAGSPNEALIHLFLVVLELC